MSVRDRVVLVNPDGTPRGTATREEAHDQPGMLHSAVSLVLSDERGELLIQRRAMRKPLFAGLWSNACCTHPRPAESDLHAVVRRAHEELGVELIGVSRVGAFVYHATDPVSGLVEHERDVVFVAQVDGELAVDPDEASAWAWIPPRADVRDRRFTPWAGEVFRMARGDRLSRERGAG
jgi:isopentenyl-diphosphate Delta-isomerase